MVDGRHFENSFIIISQAWISDFDELGLQIQILVPRMVTWQKIKILKIQNGRDLFSNFTKVS